MYELNICHLYHDLLNLYGDGGNVAVLKKRAEWRHIAVNIYNITIGDAFTPEKYDIVFLGGGQDYEQEIIQEDLLKQKGTEIRNAVANNKVFLAICGGYQMLGNYYRVSSGREIRFLGALNLWTAAGPRRMIGNMAFKCTFLAREDFDGVMVGFENHSGKTFLGPEVKPLGKVLAGFGNNGRDGFEGALYKNTFCTYSHGCLLPKNPVFADHILTVALKQKYRDFVSLQKLDDSLENLARDVICRRLFQKV